MLCNYAIEYFTNLCSKNSSSMSATGKKVLVIGICGATCSGKTTVAKELNKIVLDSRIFCQDDYFFPVDDPRHVWIPELAHINFDIVSSLDMERMTRDIQEHINNESSRIPVFEPATESSAETLHSEKSQNVSKIKNDHCHLVIVEGFCIFNYKPLAELCDLKYYFTLEYDECFRRRQRRTYEPPDCPGYFEQCAWPEHMKHLAEVKRDLKDVIYFNGNSMKHSEKILKDIVEILK